MAKAWYTPEDFDTWAGPVKDEHEGTLDWCLATYHRNTMLAEKLEGVWPAARLQRLRECCANVQVNETEGMEHPWITSGRACNVQKACRFCARKRSGDLATKLLSRMIQLVGVEGVKEFAFVTLTQPSGPDLAERRANLARLWNVAAGRAGGGRALFTAFRAEEITMGQACLWHVHYHVVVHGGVAAGALLIERWLDASAESNAAAQDVRPLDGQGFREASKYALKIAELPIGVHALALPLLDGQRMAACSGGLYGLDTTTLLATHKEVRLKARFERDSKTKTTPYVFSQAQGIYKRDTEIVS